jgi:hypothetical protein
MTPQDSYNKIDRFLRNNLNDDDYAEYSEALDYMYLVPQGWKLVPVEPTQHMCNKAYQRYQDWRYHSDGSPYNLNGYKEIYKAMTSAAPELNQNEQK